MLRANAPAGNGSPCRSTLGPGWTFGNCVQVQIGIITAKAKESMVSS